MINEQIFKALAGFEAEGQPVPVAFAHYSGNADKYVTFQDTDAAAVYADDWRQVIAHYVDFDIYTRGSYAAIAAQLITTLEEAGGRLMVALCSGDLYETDTGLYHKTLCFEFTEHVNK